MVPKGVHGRMPKQKSKKTEKEVVRVAFRLHGSELQQIREVRDMVSLNSELDAARYLMQRGLEALSGQLGNRRLVEKMTTSMTPEHMVAAMMKIMGPEQTQAVLDVEEAKK